MKTFLQEVAETVYKKNSSLEEVTMVFPNRRAILFFRKHLSELIQKPVFSPTLLTIEEFISRFSTLKVPDKLELIFQLYKVYNDVVRNVDAEETPSGVDQFFFWGDMLLRDFDEIDKYMVDAVQLFRDLSHQKELDSSFDYLTEEQREFLRSFWGSFDENESANKKKFLRLWRQLPQVYTAFKDVLSNQGMAFEGMLHRDVATQLSEGKLSIPFDNPVNIKFAGFNALTVVEEKIISFFVDKGAEVYWDMDAYYVNNAAQEAGRFFREYQQHTVLRKTFSQDVYAGPFFKTGSSDTKPRKPVRIFGAAQPVGQAKLLAHVLKEEIARGMKPEETLVVLPDEKLLLPVLHGISGSVEKLNVTMGFPLSATPVFNFVELLLDLQINFRNDHFNHRQALALLGHPYVVTADAAAASAKRKEILKNNWVHIPTGFLSTGAHLHRVIFRSPNVLSDVVTMSDLILYLKEIISTIGRLPTLGDVDKEYAFHFVKFFNRLQEIFVEKSSDESAGPADLKSFLRLFRQLIKAHKIPFTGEPLRGLQVMGVLETRNLDFKNVFVLSLNEGAFPSMGAKASYIPYTIRKAYKLPTVEHQDSIYSYLFYRVLQRSENVSIFYNSETDVLGQGEMSRYLQQLIYESGLQIERKTLHNPIQPQGIQPIVVKKNDQVMESLLLLNEGNKYFKGISPSALNSYLDCRLKFYFRHVAKVREPDEIEEELDARVLGNFLHDVMERYYKQIVENKHDKLVEPSDYEGYESKLDKLIDGVFIEAYRLNPDKEVKYEGQRLVVREVIKRFAHRIIEIDRVYAPFSIEALEQDGLIFSVNIAHPPYKAVVGGKIDRVDRKGEVVRVIDYKTGKDKLTFESVASLFARDTNRNKAAFQTLLYALLYKSTYLQGRKSRLVPGLINRMNLFDEGFSFGLKVGKEQVLDAEPLLPEFEEHLKTLFEELFNPEIAFDQTNNTENCAYCPYGQICYR